MIRPSTPDSPTSPPDSPPFIPVQKELEFYDYKAGYDPIIQAKIDRFEQLLANSNGHYQTALEHAQSGKDTQLDAKVRKAYEHIENRVVELKEEMAKLPPRFGVRVKPLNLPVLDEDRREPVIVKSKVVVPEPTPVIPLAQIELEDPIFVKKTRQRKKYRDEPLRTAYYVHSDDEELYGPFPEAYPKKPKKKRERKPKKPKEKPVFIDNTDGQLLSDFYY